MIRLWLYLVSYDVYNLFVYVNVNSLYIYSILYISIFLYIVLYIEYVGS